MEQTKHTLGPWEVTHFDGRTQVFAGRRIIVEGLYDENNEPTLEEVEANACLIAAAPDLLEALKAVYADIELQNVEGGSDELNLMVQMAISKAEGKEI